MTWYYDVQTMRLSGRLPIVGPHSSSV